MNYMLKINPIELVALDVLLKHVLSSNPDNAIIQTYLGSIHKNVTKKKKDYQDVFLEPDKDFASIFAEQICGNLGVEVSKELPSSAVDKITCADCHFNSTDCQKKEELKRYWGHNESEFADYRKKYTASSADECMMFMHKMKLSIVGLVKESESLYDVEIESNGEISRYQYNASNLRLFIHKYGKDSIINYNQFKDIL